MSLPVGPQRFWQRITEGAASQQLWGQLRADAQATYKFYAADSRLDRRERERAVHWYFRMTRAILWAMAMKLSPGRRVLFLVSLLLLLFPVVSFNNDQVSFSTEGLRFFGGLGFLVLLALELADRVTMKRDLEIAREIQGWLMPAAPPSVPGIDIAFSTRPANTVAGDYYDAFFRPAAPPDTPAAEPRLLLVVADVAGKSIPAALVMATMQASLRTLSALPGSLLELVDRLNDYACRQNQTGRRFTTAFLAELQPATGFLTWINAGHNWPVLRRASGAVERLETGGLPLGLMKNAPYECGSTTLAPGDVLLIFTDGLVEAENEREEEYDEPRMLETLASSHGSAQEILTRLMSSVDAFVGSTRQHDDITCMVVRCAAS